MNHYMIDIETLGTSKKALVLSIALVRFNEQEILDSLILYPNLKEQEESGRKIELDTLIWWMKNPSIFLSNIDSDQKTRKSIAFCYNQVAYFLRPDKEGRTIWAKSPSFDLHILSDLFSHALPLWTYKEESDVRTVENKLIQKQKEIIRPSIAHDPMNDALAQVMNVREYLAI